MKDWALILGASSGIGAECAKRLAKRGINIYGVYLRKKNSYNNVASSNIYFVSRGISQYFKQRHIWQGIRKKNMESRNCKY